MSVSTIAYLRAWLLAQYPEWRAGEELGPVRLSALKGRRPGRWTLMVFRDRERWPSLVVKVATIAEDATHLAREATVLDLAQHDLKRILGDQIPRHLGLIQDPRFTALAATAVRGRRARLPDMTRPAPSRSDRRRLQSHVEAVRAWSRSLPHTPNSLPRDAESIAIRIQRFMELGHPAPRARARLESLAAAIDSSGVQWLTRWQHGDVAGGNVLRHRRRIRLVDWEAASPAHDPWRDDTYLILSLARAVQRTTGAYSVSAALRDCLGNTTWAGHVLANSYRDNWPHQIPIRWAVIATTIELALEMEDRGTTTPHWRNLAIDLLCDDELRMACAWLLGDD